ncbi:MAG: hypothetical protein ACYCOO_02660 [Chitinophagaceae bacterium]
MMKKIRLGLLSVALAMVALVATKAHSKMNRLTELYWYQTTDNGTVIIPDSTPPLQASDPFNCVGKTYYCSKAYTSYNPVTFAPAGSLMQTDKKDNQ